MDKSVTAGDFEICVQWFQSDVESVSLEEAEDTQAQPKALFLLYALNNKALNLASSPGSAQVKAGLCRVTDTYVQALHEKLMATLETAENDLIPVQTSQAAVGTTEQNKSEFVDLKRLKTWEREQILNSNKKLCGQWRTAPGCSHSGQFQDLYRP